MLFKKKRKYLTPDEKIEAASTKVNGAFIMFQQAHDALEEAKGELSQAVTEADDRINSLRAQLEVAESTKDKALKDIDKYDKLDDKILEFTIQED